MRDKEDWWRLDGGKINDLQQASLQQLVQRCKAAHFTNVRVRINGKWEEYEADWIKHLSIQPRPILAAWRHLLWLSRCRWSSFKYRLLPRATPAIAGYAADTNSKEAAPAAEPPQSKDRT